METEYVSLPLDIQGVKVNKVTVTSEGEVHICVTSTIEGTHCHCCGREINKLHEYDREITLRH